MLRYRLALLRWRLTHPRQTLAEIFIRLFPIRLRIAILSRFRRTSRATPNPASFEIPNVRVRGAARQPSHEISLIIPTHSRRDLLELCLSSLELSEDRNRMEIIVIDDGSDEPEVVSKLGRRFGAVTVRSMIHRGYAASVNTGVAASNGKTFVLLNDDTIVSKKWVAPLVAALSSDERIGIVQPLTNSSGNEARVRPRYVDHQGLEAFAESIRRRRSGELFSLPRAAFFCVAMRRSTWSELGPLDERFDTGFFEDEDYSRRARIAGYEIVCAADSYVHHWGSATIGQLGRDRLVEQYEESRRRYREKWEFRIKPAKHK